LIDRYLIDRLSTFVKVNRRIQVGSDMFAARIVVRRHVKAAARHSHNTRSMDKRLASWMSRHGVGKLVRKVNPNTIAKLNRIRQADHQEPKASSKKKLAGRIRHVWFLFMRLMGIRENTVVDGDRWCGCPESCIQ
jgi:hypothetical protein